MLSNVVHDVQWVFIVKERSSRIITTLLYRLVVSMQQIEQELNSESKIMQSAKVSFDA